MSSEVIPSFVSLSWYHIDGRGDACSTKLDRETRDFSHLIQKEIEVDGVRYKCLGVERFLHGEPWIKGEHIGLLVEKLPGKPNEQQ